MVDSTLAPPPSDRFGRRELNFAESRLGLLAAAMDLAADSGLADIPVDEIARRAGVSRMTFFNRFPHKDALWLYFVRTWWFGDSVAQALEPARGFAAIRRVFRRIAEADRQHRRFFQGFAGFITRMDESRDLLEEMRLTAAEKALLRPDVEGAESIEAVPMDRRLIGHLEEARADGDLPAGADAHALMVDLAAVMYGEVLMAVVLSEDDLWPRYERQLDRIERCPTRAETEDGGR